MIKILFICHGNICRSPMAKYICIQRLKDLKLEKEFFVDSMAVSNEEEGNDIYPLAKKTLTKYQIPFERHKARKFTKEDYIKFDYIFLMDSFNKRLIDQIVSDPENKIAMLSTKDIKDPWYDHRFDECFNDLSEAINEILIKIIKEQHDK